jgi:glycine/D-amino acid oxidase-like deaminating enzyme
MSAISSARRTCDIVVLGAGIAGCTAAQAASSAGASVICCEKFGAYTAHGTDIGAIGTSVQRAAGVAIDSALAARLIYEWSQQQANYYLIRTFTEKSGEILDYYIDMAHSYGLKVTLNDEMTARSDWHSLEDKFKQFQSAHLFEITPRSPFKKGKWNAAYFVE